MDYLTLILMELKYTCVIHLDPWYVYISVLGCTIHYPTHLLIPYIVQMHYQNTEEYQQFESITCPAMMHAGIHYEDINRYGVQFSDSMIPLTVHDKRKARSLMVKLKERHLPQSIFLLRQLSKMLHLNYKAEIECIHDPLVLSDYLAFKLNATH